MAEAVFFDFGDTLAYGYPRWEEPQIRACAELGVSVTPEQVKKAIWRIWGPLEGCVHPDASASEETYRRWIGAIERSILAEMGLAEMGLVSGLDEAAARVMELQVAPSSYRVFPEVLATLDGLRRRGLRLGIVSNNAWGLPDLLRQLGLGDHFEVVVTSARAGCRKPRPEIFQQALERVGIAPADAVYVGDDYDLDVLGARQVGMLGVLVDRRNGPRRDCPTLYSLDEVLGLV